jgi:hypothetical protein
MADEASAPPYANLGYSLQKSFTHLQTSRARLICAIAAIGAERFRIRYGRWPESLSALVPEFVPAFSADPFSGEPLRYERLPDGVVIYAVGPDLTDNGGNLATFGADKFSPPPAGTDVGFRLWDVPHRGQAPKGEPP